MDISTLFGKLDISTLGLVWARLTGGWRGLAVYLCKAVTRLLKKLPASELARYAELIRAVLNLVRTIVDKFLGEKYKAAGEATCVAIETLLAHIEDGEYTEDELDADIDNIEKCIDAWKSVGK